MTDAVVGESTALDHGREAMLSNMRELKVARQCRLDVGIDKKDTVSHVRQQTTNVGAECCFAYAAFGGDY